MNIQKRPQHYRTLISAAVFSDDSEVLVDLEAELSGSLLILISASRIYS